MKPCAALLSLVLALCACGRSDSPSDLAGRLPVEPGVNVLIISFDALRADALGLYGYHRPTSPNLDRFAEQAVVFEHAYSAAPVTPTSFAAAFTGQLPFRVFSAWNLVETDTLAGTFAAAGYDTFALLNNTQLVAERNFHQGWDRYEVVDLSDEDLLAQALERIDAASDQRFFGWVHFISPHTPYERRDLAAQFYDPDYRGRYEQTTGGKFEVADEAELARVRDLYDGEVYFADHLFGQLIDHLERRGLMNDTLIVVTTDHGEEFMDHGGLQHNSQYEELIRVPLLIRHPRVPSGSRTDAPYLNTDLLPTLAAIAGIQAVPEVPDGLDLTREWRPDRLRISVGMTHRERRQMSGTRGPDKLIVTCKPDYQEALYDLEQDPGETTDRILDDPKTAGEVFSAMQQQVIGEPCTAIEMAVGGHAAERGLSEEQIEKLKSLGYLQ